MIQRFPIVLAEVKACDTSENLLNEIKQIISSLYRPKKITKEVYNNILNSINSIKLLYKVTKILYLWIHRLLLNLLDENKLKKKWWICCSIKS